MRFGNSARAMTRQRRRRPRLMRCQTKNKAAMTSAAISDVAEKCEPSESTSLLSWLRKKLMVAEKSKAGSRGAGPNVLPESKYCVRRTRTYVMTAASAEGTVSWPI